MRNLSENETLALFADKQQAHHVAEELREGLGRLFLFPLLEIIDSIKSFHYLGPLRVTPKREYRAPQSPDPSRWASGLGAWDVLHTGDPELVEQVGQWLSDPENLNAGCHIRLVGCP